MSSVVSILTAKALKIIIRELSSYGIGLIVCESRVVSSDKILPPIGAESQGVATR